MDTNLIRATIMALCLVVSLFSAEGSIAFLNGAQYQASTSNQVLRGYYDLGDGDAAPESMREGYILLNNQVSATVQFNWESLWQPLEINVANGEASFTLGQGSSATTNTVSFQGTSFLNALFVTTSSLGSASGSSPRGINFGITEANGQTVTGSISGTYTYPVNAGGGYGMLYGFDLSSSFNAKGWVEILIPSGASANSVAFQMGFWHTDLVSLPEPTSGLLLIVGAGLVGGLSRHRRR